MKKIKIFVILFLALNFIAINNVFASTKLDIKLGSNIDELEKGEQVEVTFKLEHFQGIDKGINAYKATLEYDKNIFEEVVQSDFICQNGWESLKYNPSNNEFVAIKKVGITKSENVVKIRLKVKNNVDATKTFIKVKNVEVSEGKKDISLQDAEIILDIIEKQPAKPTKPNKPSSIITNRPTTSLNITGSKVGNLTKTNTVSGNINKPTDEIDDPNESENKPTDSGDSKIETPIKGEISEKPTDLKDGSIKQNVKKYTVLLILIFIAILIIICLKSKLQDKNINSKKYVILLAIGIAGFMGTTVALAYSFALKGELNGDSQINYADLSLLELHLIDLKRLPDEKLENADMNSDGKITITDLSILVQKLERTLDYNVIISNIETENYYPDKNQNITFKLNADVSYDASIKKLIINGKEYEVEKLQNNDSMYNLVVNSGNIAGLKTYKITSALLDNNKTVKIDYKIDIDVLKELPYINNYRVEEDLDNSKLILLFDVIDKDDSIESASVTIYNDDQSVKTKEKIKKGQNRIEVQVEEKKEYKAYIALEYNLDSNSLENDEDHGGTNSYEKDLQLLVDYDFKISNIKTYKDEKETTTFANGDKVKIGFESTNLTKYVPTTIKVDGKEYEVTLEGKNYIATLDELNELGNKTIYIEEVILSNGKKFELKDNNLVEINIIKRNPDVLDVTTTEFIENNSLKVMFELDDKDEAVSEINIILLDSEGNEIDKLKLNRDEIRADGTFNKFLKTKMTSEYQLQLLMSYNLTGKETDNVVNKIIYNEKISAEPRVIINQVEVDKKYVKKGESVKLTYDLESNQVDDIKRIMVNNTEYMAYKLDNGNYEVTLKVGNESGIYPLTTTKFYYDEAKIAESEKTILVDILKDKPSIEKFSQDDNPDDKEVTLKFNVRDDENSFISGKAILRLNDISIEKEISKGNNELTFKVEPMQKYTLEIMATYDLDTNTLLGPDEDNKVVDEVIDTREVQLIADYELNIDNIKTYNSQGETKYFSKDEPIKISFESSNVTSFEPVKVLVNGNEYNLEKIENAYYFTVESHKTSGVKTARIEKIILSNSKGILISKNNEINVTVLKDKPTVEQFGYKENLDATVSASFNVVDKENAITAGKVVIMNGKNIVKEQAIKVGQNTIVFQPVENNNYIAKVIADYDLDMNVLEEDANEYKNMTLLEADITLGARRFEVKDIIRTSVYKKTTDGVVEVKDLKESDLSNLDNYIAKVYMKQMPTFYTVITGYRIEDNQLKLTLDYDNVVQYTNDNKQDKLEIVFGDMVDGVAENVTLEGLIREMEANPTGTFTLTRDYDASIITKNTNALISSSFMGKLNGNGHKIYNLSKPLFESIESATIENLVLESPKLSGPNSRGTIANAALNSVIRNVHVKDLTLISGTNRVGGIVGEATSTTIEQSSVTNFEITTSLHIRVAGMVGNMTGGSIKNSYVEGNLKSTQNKDGNGISGILGTGEGTEVITIENCITKVTYTNNVSARLNGDIVGLALNNNTSLKNNVSLSTGSNFYSIHGSTVHATSTNNYELTDSGLVTNASGERVKQVAKEELTTEFFKNSANFDDSIWDLSNVSYDEPPVLLVTKENEEISEEKPSNSKLYIPDYSRIKKINGYSESKDILYHNINKLMPYYDAKYLIEDGLKIANDHILNTKIIKHILPYSNGKMVTYLTKQNSDSITSIKIVFEDFTVSEYNVTFKEVKQDISIYEMEELDLEYAYDNYVIKDNASIVETLKNYISNIDYKTTLDPLTTTADSRLYRDHYNETMKPLAEVIALQLLQNDGNSVLTLDSEILNDKIKQELIDSGRLDKILYAYNYYHRWYKFEIGGSKVSDILLFEGKMYKDNMTIDNMTEEVLTGNMGTNVTNTFYVNSIRKYTDSANLGLFLDNIIENIGGYEDINDWFTEHFSSIGILSEIPVDSHPEVMYRAWARLKGFQNFILPLSTLPKYAGYIVSGPAQFQVGAQRVYTNDPTTTAGQNTMRNIINNHSKLIKRQFDTLAGSFHVESWNNFTIMVYDTVKTITGYKTSYLPGTNIPIGTSPVTTWNRTGTTTEPFSKNFNEAVGAWQYGSAAGVGNTAGFLWFIARPGLTNYDTWTHEFEHALWDKIMMFRKGTRLGLENYTEGNVEQNETWSNNTLNGYDVGPYYFNLAFTLSKEGLATQNLTPERINTKEKLENYFKGQFDALELLDYVSAKAFIQLTPEEQAKIATRMAQSAGYSSWGTITAAQAETMNLTTLESLWDNRIILRPNNAWGVSVRGLAPINSIGGDDYGYESIWVTRWYIGHYDNGYSDAFSNKKNMFEMLGYAGVNGYVTYGSRLSSTDLDAIQKITLAKTGTAMNWKEYKMSRYAEIESKFDNKYVNVEWMIEKFKEALKNDARNGNRNITNATNLRKIYYHYLKRATNDFIADPLGTDIEMTHIKTAEDLVQKINARPYGYYILDNDIDFSKMKTNVTQTFMGKLDGNGHKITGNTLPIFQKIRYGSVTNLVLEDTNIPKTSSNVGALAVKVEYSVLENITAKNIQMNFGNRNEMSLIGGSVSTVTYKDCNAYPLKTTISTPEDFDKLVQDPGGIFVIDRDIDFSGYTKAGSVVNVTFTGKIDGNGHTLSNLTNASLFSNFNGTIENVNIKDFSNVGTGNFVNAFAQYTNNAKLKNMKFDGITLSGQHNVAVVSGQDKSNSTFENISVKNADVKGTGVYVSTFIGRKYSGIIKNVFVEGNLEIKTTENGGVVGALQEGGTIENVISKVNIHKPENTYSNIAESEHNGGIVGNIYNSPKIKNSIALGDMEGFTDANGAEKTPYKLVGATATIIASTIENCYEYADAKGFSSIDDQTNQKLKQAVESDIHSKEFYKDTLNFDESIWNFDSVSINGYPELK